MTYVIVDPENIVHLSCFCVYSVHFYHIITLKERFTGCAVDTTHTLMCNTFKVSISFIQKQKRTRPVLINVLRWPCKAIFSLWGKSQEVYEWVAGWILFVLLWSVQTLTDSIRGLSLSFVQNRGVYLKCVCLCSYLQCATIGPASGGLRNLTCRMNPSSPVA